MRFDSVRTDTGKIEGFCGRRDGVFLAEREYFPSQQRINVSSVLSGPSDREHVFRTSDHLHPDARREPRSRCRVGNDFARDRSLLNKTGSEGAFYGHIGQGEQWN